MTEQEKKDKRFGTILTTALHVLVLAVFFFLVAWREPDPPVPEYGIELNFGLVEEGGGDQESELETETEITEEDTPPDADVETEEAVEETVEEAVPETNPTEAKEVIQETPPPVEEVVEKAVETQEESTVKVEEKTEEVSEEKTEEVQEEVTPPVEKKVEEKPKPVVDDRALMGGKKTDNTTKDPASNNQGTYPDKKGNQGDPEGNKETQGTNPGGEDLGVSYSLDGWKWTRPPAEKDDSQIDGVIKFSINVDDRGTVLSVSVIPGTTISDNTIIDFYKKQVQRLSFVQLDPSKSTAAISKGTVTFVIKTK